jgi:hypothetical protein
MKKKHILVSCIVPFVTLGWGTTIAQSYERDYTVHSEQHIDQHFSHSSSSTSFSVNPISYDEVNVYHHYDRPPEDEGKEALRAEELKILRDQRLENLVNDPNDYKLDSDVAPSSSKYKHNNKKHKKTVNKDNCDDDE